MNSLEFCVMCISIGLFITGILLLCYVFLFDVTAKHDIQIREMYPECFNLDGTWKEQEGGD
jgi:hypothetical protein